MSTHEHTPTASSWLVESLRVTAFYRESVEPEWGGIWEKLTGLEPENRNAQPKAKSLSEDGEWEAGKLVVACSDKRTDLVYSRKEEKVTAVGKGEEDPPSFKTLAESMIGEFNGSVLALRRVIDRWKLLTRDPNRIAFGAVLGQIVSDRVAGYQRLAEWLKNPRIDPEGSRDFLYRINRPRKVALGGNLEVLINRLMTWSVAHRQIVRIDVGDRLPTPSAAGDKEYMTRLEMDVNTDAEFDEPFNASQREAIIDQLIEFAQEISEKGDVP